MDGENESDLRRGHGGTRRGAGHGEADTRQQVPDLGRRQELRRARQLRRMRITPLAAQNTANRSSAIGGRKTRHAGYVVRQEKRKRVQQSFGWM